jgi:hypothetical protein
MTEKKSFLTLTSGLQRMLQQFGPAAVRTTLPPGQNLRQLLQEVSRRTGGRQSVDRRRRRRVERRRRRR